MEQSEGYTIMPNRSWAGGGRPVWDGDGHMRPGDGCVVRGPGLGSGWGVRVLGFGGHFLLCCKPRNRTAPRGSRVRPPQLAHFRSTLGAQVLDGCGPRTCGSGGWLGIGFGYVQSFGSYNTAWWWEGSGLVRTKSADIRIELYPPDLVWKPQILPVWKL